MCYSGRKDEWNSTHSAIGKYTLQGNKNSVWSTERATTEYSDEKKFKSSFDVMLFYNVYLRHFLP